MKVKIKADLVLDGLLNECKGFMAERNDDYKRFIFVFAQVQALCENPDKVAGVFTENGFFAENFSYQIRQNSKKTITEWCIEHNMTLLQVLKNEDDFEISIKLL